jgi:hypothetical protein
MAGRSIGIETAGQDQGKFDEAEFLQQRKVARRQGLMLSRA